MCMYLLQAKTTNFVDKLFAALESKEYLNFTPPSPAKDTKTTGNSVQIIKVYAWFFFSL